MAEYFTVALLSIMIFYSFGIAFNVHKTLDKEKRSGNLAEWKKDFFILEILNIFSRYNLKS